MNQNGPESMEYGIGKTTGRVFAARNADMSAEDQQFKAREAAKRMRMKSPDSFIKGWLDGYQEASSGPTPEA